jgi:hypothetical protein
LIQFLQSTRCLVLRYLEVNLSLSNDLLIQEREKTLIHRYQSKKEQSKAMNKENKCLFTDTLKTLLLAGNAFIERLYTLHDDILLSHNVQGIILQEYRQVRGDF